jgi:hypothetical protein
MALGMVYGIPLELDVKWPVWSHALSPQRFRLPLMQQPDSSP